MPMSRSSPRILKKKPLAKKLLKAVQSRRLAPTATPSETLSALKANYPNAHCELNFNSPFELLVATILSAQCTDQRVNIVTKVLFAKYPTAEKMAVAKIADLEDIVRSTGFFKNKAKNLQNCAQALVEKHGGKERF
jgi:endonuclease-3